MSSLYSRASGFISDALSEHFASVVTYKRGHRSISDLKVTTGETPFRYSDTDGLVILERSRDFIVKASELAIDGEQIRPKAGDTITDASGRVFTVSAPNGEPDFRYMDPTDSMIRIHSRLTKR